VQRLEWDRVDREPAAVRLASGHMTTDYNCKVATVTLAAVWLAMRSVGGLSPLRTRHHQRINDRGQYEGMLQIFLELVGYTNYTFRKGRRNELTRSSSAPIAIK